MSGRQPKTPETPDAAADTEEAPATTAGPGTPVGRDFTEARTISVSEPRHGRPDEATNEVTAVTGGGRSRRAGTPTPAPAGGQLAEASRYDDEGRIGTGGMGEVHVVYDRVLLRRVAMKSLHDGLSREDEHTQRFLEEVQITGQLDHPNIVPVHDVGFHASGNAFFIMKLVNGQTLGSMLAEGADGPLIGRRLEELLQVFLKICDGIDFAHSRRVIHRDLKPSNIMVGHHGEVYVMDWGIALIYDSHKQSRAPFMPEIFRSGEVHRESAAGLMGTPRYMAPEQARARIDEIDFRTDVFGLGGILYEILTGEAPYAAESGAIQLEMARLGDVLPPAEVAPGRRLPPGLCRIAMKALAENRRDRYQDVRELKEAVQGFLRGGGWFHIREVEPGTVIVAEGDEADAAYVIQDGYCEVYKGEGADRQFLRKLGPGDVFGETAIFTRAPRTATVAALDRVKLAAITGESLDFELEEKGWFGEFVRALAQRFREHDSRVAEMRAELSEARAELARVRGEPDSS